MTSDRLNPRRAESAAKTEFKVVLKSACLPCAERRAPDTASARRVLRPSRSDTRSRSSARIPWRTSPTRPPMPYRPGSRRNPCSQTIAVHRCGRDERPPPSKNHFDLRAVDPERLRLKHPSAVTSRQRTRITLTDAWLLADERLCREERPRASSGPTHPSAYSAVAFAGATLPALGEAGTLQRLP